MSTINETEVKRERLKARLNDENLQPHERTSIERELMRLPENEDEEAE